MALPWRTGGPARDGGPGDHGVLLLGGNVAGAAAWAQRGVVPVHVGSVEGWTVVLPAGGSAAHPPYDDGLSLLAARPVPGRLRPAIGLYAAGGLAVATVQPAGWRAIQRYAVWRPGAGVTPAGGLKLARPSDLVSAAGVEGPAASAEARAEVRDLLRGRGADPLAVLQALADVLRLPVAGLLDHSTSPAALTDHRVVEPAPAAVKRFDDTVHQDARQRAELEGR